MRSIFGLTFEHLCTLLYAPYKGCQLKVVARSRVSFYFPYPYIHIRSNYDKTKRCNIEMIIYSFNLIMMTSP